MTQPVWRRFSIALFPGGATQRWQVMVCVIACHEPGQACYRGVLTRQVKVDGTYHDEVFMEMHFGDRC